MDRNVEYILEVARCGGITRAAENLFITPSALSKYVIALEDQLQVKLFHRIGKSFVPTKAGEYYIRRCMEIEQIYQEMGQEMESIACISRRILRLGVQPNLAERVLRFVLPKLQERLPGIRISMHETRGDSLISMLKDQNLDVVIAIVGEKEKSLDYRWFPCVKMLWPWDMVIHCVRKHGQKMDSAIRGFHWNCAAASPMSC